MRKILNIAVIAHVDHGKTTLVDALLKQTSTFRDNQSEMNQTQIMDSNDLERERGITILAKNCAIEYKDVKINIIDTPGHADFSGEVERTLGMADGALLIVDAQEGPMPQTRFVLKKALELGLKVIVVINKIDKQFANPLSTRDKVETLFLELASSEEQLDFPVVYAIGAKGATFADVPEEDEPNGDVNPLLDTVLEEIKSKESDGSPFKMSVSSIDYDAHTGRSAIGRIHSGEIRRGQKVVLASDPQKYFTIEKVLVYKGLGREEVESAAAPEIVSLNGIGSVKIGETICDPSDVVELDDVHIGEPTINITIGPNTSPLAGREGKFFTSRQIEERLNKELEKNLGLRIKKLGDGRYIVSGRGELHLSVLLETMRREGFELEVGKPEVVVKEIDGKRSEPLEEVTILVPEEYVGVINQELGKRYAQLKNMQNLDSGEVEFVYEMPTRAIIGLRNLLVTQTKGTVIFSSNLIGYTPVGKEIPQLRKGVLMSSETGDALAYGLANAAERGVLFIDPGTKVYEGMIIGLNSKENDIAMNVCKGKKLTNMRSSSSDGNIQLSPATKLSLEQSLDFLEDDELLEITPESLRLRKKHLSELDRKRANK